ncbi:hypothetical protein B0H19DRAFT_937851, partial [Mycena capillaripes]
KAHKLVVVSAGAMGSPLIFERSGIGRKDVLERTGIPVIAELSGVGENYHDHGFVCLSYLADSGTETLNSLFRGVPETWATTLEQWEKDGSRMLGTNGVEGAIKMRPRAEELAELDPDFKKYWGDSLAGKPDKPVGFARFCSWV